MISLADESVMSEPFRRTTYCLLLELLFLWIGFPRDVSHVAKHPHLPVKPRFLKHSDVGRRERAHFFDSRRSSI